MGIWNSKHSRHYIINSHWLCGDVCSDIDTNKEKRENIEDKMDNFG